MQKILFILLIFSLFSCLQAYSKKIIFSAFSTTERAQNSLSMYAQTDSYKELYKLSLEHNFKVYTRASGKYFIVVAEPLLSQEVGVLVYDLVKKEYKGTYLNNYEAPKNEVAIKTTLQKSKEIVEKKEPIQAKQEAKQIIEVPQKEKKTQEKVKTPQVIEEKENKKSLEKTKEFAMDILDILMYIAIVLILMVVIYYFRKFKRIYDEY